MCNAACGCLLVCAMCRCGGVCARVYAEARSWPLVRVFERVGAAVAAVTLKLTYWLGWLASELWGSTA